MREAMTRAEVGDDVYGDDPTVIALEQEIARITGKEAALFVTSGTMGNQLAIATQTRHGDDVIVGEGAHPIFYEAAAGAALSGVQFSVAGRGGLFDARRARRRGSSASALGAAHVARGGREHTQPGRRTRVASGRRAVAGRESARARVRGAPRRRSGVERERGVQRRRGDPLRALRHGQRVLLEGPRRPRRQRVLRLAEGRGRGAPTAKAMGRRDAPGGHPGGRRAATRWPTTARAWRTTTRTHACSPSGMAGVEGARVELDAIQTNLFNIDVGPPASDVAREARVLGVLIGASGPHRLRAATHLDVSRAQIDTAGEMLAQAVLRAMKTDARTTMNRDE